MPLNSAINLLDSFFDLNGFMRSSKYASSHSLSLVMSHRAIALWMYTRNTVGASILAITNEVLNVCPKVSFGILSPLQKYLLSSLRFLAQSLRSLAFSRTPFAERALFIRAHDFIRNHAFHQVVPLDPVAVAPPIVLSTYNQIR